MLRFFDEYLINGMPLLLPDADINMTVTDLDSADSGRDESGVMHRFVVRHNVKTWEFSYGALSEESYRYMRNLTDGKADFIFSYMENGQRKETFAYCSNHSIVYHDAAKGLYKNYKFTVIEC